MSYGLNVFDANGVQTLGMDDFTLQKLGVFSLPASSGSGEGVRSDYLTLDVPGYDPSSCYVVITPAVYSSGQLGYADSWGVLPVYKDLGGTQIAIFTYVNYKASRGGDEYYNYWVSTVAACVIEVVRVI